MTPIGISPDYFRTTFWMEHLHGMSGHLFWWWGRNINGGPNGEFLGGLMTQPQLVDIWGKTVLEMRRLIDYITLFPQLERKVRILYSEPSSIQDKAIYTDELNRVYETGILIS